MYFRIFSEGDFLRPVKNLSCFCVSWYVSVLNQPLLRSIGKTCRYVLIGPASGTAQLDLKHQVSAAFFLKKILQCIVYAYFHIPSPLNSKSHFVILSLYNGLIAESVNLPDYFVYYKLIIIYYKLIIIYIKWFYNIIPCFHFFLLQFVHKNSQKLALRNIENDIKADKQ